MVSSGAAASATTQMSLAKIKPGMPSVNDLPLLVKKSRPNSRPWLRIDAEGVQSVLEASKLAIMNRVRIPARDLRMLDPQLNYPSTILVRDRALVVNLEDVKALICADEVLFQSAGDAAVKPVVDEISRRLRRGEDDGSVLHDDNTGEKANHPATVVDKLTHTASPSVEMDKTFVDGGTLTPKAVVPTVAIPQPQIGLPFEFRVLEVILESVCANLSKKAEDLQIAIYEALDALTFKISSLNLERVRKVKSTMTRLNARCMKVREELESLLDDDSDMADMYLTRRQNPPSPMTSILQPRPRLSITRQRSFPDLDSPKGSLIDGVAPEEEDIAELEMLLEVYFMQIDGTVNHLATLREYIDDTEDYINLELDNHRNQLIQLDLILTAGTLTMAFASSIFGLFGMNLRSNIESNQTAFFLVRYGAAMFFESGSWG
eukprot:jgi/Mesvir1/28765/Mv19732-RA.1